MRHPSVPICLMLAAAPVGCRQATDERAAGVPATRRSLFADITGASGIDFVHQTGCAFGFYYPEIMGAGAAVFDYDGDGRLDVYLINGTIHGHRGADAPPPVNAPVKAVNRLFRRDPGGVYHDVSAESGLDDAGYGMGVAVGDIDNDGDADVYVTNVGPNALYRNDGDGTFTNVTAVAGVAGDSWSASACFFDYDRDGYLDIYVTNYLNYDPSRQCLGADGSPDYCGPQAFDGAPDVLYHNEGDGTFADAGDALVIGTADADRTARKGLGVVCIDFNGDDRPDIYVANDGEPNQLWINRGGGVFRDEAMTRGVALNADGRTEGSMGVAAGDVDGDGTDDLFITHLWKESHTLYLGHAGGSPSPSYTDATAAAGLNRATTPLTGFGVAMFDFDHDGDLDILATNGRVFRDDPLPNARGALFWTFYAEPNLLFANDGRGRFQNVSAACGNLCTDVEVGRGLVTADLDGDGDLDVLLTNGGGAARVFRNDAARRGHWLMVRALDAKLTRDAIGAQVTVASGGRRQHRWVTRTYSYLSSGDARVHFGLGDSTTIDQLSVRWPSGVTECFPPPPIDTSVTLTRGRGDACRSGGHREP